MALSVPLSRFTSRVGGGSAFFVRPRETFEIFCESDLQAEILGSSVFGEIGSRHFWTARSSRRFVGGGQVRQLVGSLADIIGGWIFEDSRDVA